MQIERSRKIVTMGPTKVVGKFPSVKSKRIHEWESQLERDRMYQLEMDPSVVEFQEQPETISLFFEGCEHRYTPDIWVTRRYGVTVEEVKPSDKVERYAALFDAAADHYAEQGIDFDVVTEETIRQQPFLDNIKTLARFRHLKIDMFVVDRLVEAFEGHRFLTFGGLEQHLVAAGVDRSLIYALAAQGLVSTDLDQPFTCTSVVTLEKGAIECLQ